MKKKPFPPHRKAAAVLWKDACAYTQRGIQEGELDDLETRSVAILSVGIVLKDDEEGIVLALSENILPITNSPGEPEIDHDGALCIPKEYIKRKKYLK